MNERANQIEWKTAIILKGRTNNERNADISTCELVNKYIDRLIDRFTALQVCVPIHQATIHEYKPVERHYTVFFDILKKKNVLLLKGIFVDRLIACFIFMISYKPDIKTR